MQILRCLCTDLYQDLALGAASLATGTVQGVFGSASSLSHAMVKGMAQLTFDGDYKRARALMDQVMCMARRNLSCCHIQTLMLLMLKSERPSTSSACNAS